MLRTLIPAISAASIQLSFLAIAFKITSCSFIIRSISRAGITWLGFTSPASPAQLDRTTHVLIRPDNSHANDTIQRIRCFRTRTVIQTYPLILSSSARGRGYVGYLRPSDSPHRTEIQLTASPEEASWPNCGLGSGTVLCSVTCSATSKSITWCQKSFCIHD